MQEVTKKRQIVIELAESFNILKIFLHTDAGSMDIFDHVNHLMLIDERIASK